MLGCCLDIAVGLGQFEIAVDQSPGGYARHLGFCVQHLAIHKVGVGGSAKEIGSQFTKRTFFDPPILFAGHDRSEEHTSELQSLMRISYAVFCLKKKTKYKHHL